MFCDRRPREPLVFPVISVAVHPLVHMITGFTNILFSTLGPCYKVDNIGRLTTSVAPDADFVINGGLSFCRFYYLALTHGRVSPSGSSSCMPV